MNRRIVTLDGPAGVGKSTMAKKVAQALGIAYLDTGAMFRAIAWHLGEEAQHLSDEKLCEFLDKLSFDLSGQGSSSELMLSGLSLGEEIRSEAVAMLASTLAKRPIVREYLKKAQQHMGQRVDLVAEGRDMGSVVFPQAQYKFFLEASVAARTMRRVLQLKAMGKEANQKEIAASIIARDEQDKNRAIAPLRPAEDAVCIDTTAMDKEQVFAFIMEQLR